MKGLCKYSTSFILGIQEAAEYRANFIIGILSSCFTIFIQFFLWTAIYNASEEPVLYGYNYPQMVVYIIMASIITRITTTDFEYEVADDIRLGTLNRFLVQPIAYFPYRVFVFLGRKALQLVLIIIISVIAITMVHFTLGDEFNPLNILLAFSVMPLALLLNCVIFFCVSMAAFWLTEAWGVFDGMYVVSTILSGGIFPLSIFGSTAQSFFKLLPFQYVVYFPLNIICGNASQEDIIKGVSAQIFWIVVIYAFSRLLWKMGMKRYIAAGG